MSKILTICFNHQTCEVDLDRLFHQPQLQHQQQAVLDTEISIPGSHKHLQIHLSKVGEDYFYHIKNLRKLGRYAESLASRTASNAPPDHAVVTINGSSHAIKKAEGSWNRRFMTPIGCTDLTHHRKHLYSTNIYVNRHHDDDVIAYFMQEILKPHKLRVQLNQLLKNCPEFEKYRTQLALPVFKEDSIVRAGLEADALMDYEFLVWANKHVKRLDTQLEALQKKPSINRHKKVSQTREQIKRTETDIRAEHEEAFAKLSPAALKDWQTYKKQLSTQAFSHNIMSFGENGPLHHRHHHILNAASTAEQASHQYQLPQLKSAFEGLWLLFASGIYHGDISPGNVVENAQQQFFLIDFGFSDAFSQEKCLHDLWASYSGGTYLYRLPCLLNTENPEEAISAEVRVLNDIYGLCFSFLSPYFQASINTYSNRDLKSHSDQYFESLLNAYASARNSIRLAYRDDASTRDALLLMLDMCRDIWSNLEVYSSTCIFLLSQALHIQDQRLIELARDHDQHWVETRESTQKPSASETLLQSLIARPSKTIKASEQSLPSLDVSPIDRSVHAENSHECPIPAKVKTVSIKLSDLIAPPIGTHDIAEQIRMRVPKALKRHLGDHHQSPNKHVIGTGFLQESEADLLRRNAIHALHDLLSQSTASEKAWALFADPKLLSQFRQQPIAGVLAEAFRATLRMCPAPPTLALVKNNADDVKVVSELLNFIKTNRDYFTSQAISFKKKWVQ